MTLLRLAACALASAVCLPAVAASTDNKPLGNWTCEDFLAVDDRFKPKVVYWATAYGKGGKPEASVVDVEGTERATPAIVDVCNKNPKASFWQTLQGERKKAEAAVKAETKKIEKAMTPAGKPVAQWNCEEFLAVDDRFKPKVVYWATALGKAGKPEAAVIDVQGTERVTPMIVDSCRKAPKASFWDNVKAEWKKVEKAI